MEDLDQEIEVPHYFLCPISLHIMKDPVTTTTAITYDRESIEQWLKKAGQPVCPVTKQPLARDSDLTPNHTLRRLIQAWCVANSEHGVERFPTPRNALTRAYVVKILRDLPVPCVQHAAFDQLLALATLDEHVKDKEVLVESGVVKSMVSYIVKCYKENKTALFVEHALRVITSLWTYISADVKVVTAENYDLIYSIMWILSENDIVNETMSDLAIILLKDLVKATSSTFVERLNLEFFEGVVRFLKSRNREVGSMKAALRVLMEVCVHGRNRYRIVEANAIFELIELELDLTLAKTERKTVSELIFCLLAELCSCAEGRAKFLAHSGGIAVLSERVLRVSPSVDDSTVHILAMISKYSATKEALQEMLRVGAVSQLFVVLQSDCAKYLKDMVIKILRMHSSVWNNSPCFHVSDAISSPNYSIKGQLWV